MNSGQCCRRFVSLKHLRTSIKIAILSIVTAFQHVHRGSSSLCAWRKTLCIRRTTKKVDFTTVSQLLSLFFEAKATLQTYGVLGCASSFGILPWLHQRTVHNNRFAGLLAYFFFHLSPANVSDASARRDGAPCSQLNV